MKVVLSDKGVELRKLEKPVYGGIYAIVIPDEHLAKTGLCLDAAYDLFKQITLERALKENKMIE